MNSISVSNLLLIIYIIVDDCYEANATALRKEQPELSYSEVRH